MPLKSHQENTLSELRRRINRVSDYARDITSAASKARGFLSRLEDDLKDGFDKERQWREDAEAVVAQLERMMKK